ncbi:acyl-CoA reductase [Sphingobacterium corticibacter]|uniref:Acyl-CoA reductase n=1 Tax=Sphingobacterium corticibacter TaxID=2171749 RepID=A0A2T8HNC6_9SPHI|nr:acyl-CoA reductase [Sphingobacterium corticibacter]PVH26931.1 acyl-CoA reductase [Sphingobacterium corticibacter]
MTKNQRINAFVQLGNYLRAEHESLHEFLARVEIKNPWYTANNVHRQLTAIAENLTQEKLTHWVATLPDQPSEKTVALVLAGNIPLVGFHDILSVLISGFHVQIKPSSDDAGLTTWILQKLVEIEPQFADKIEIVERLGAHDLIIATGSNNSARYFEYYFGQKPHIIRKNRNSVAILDGSETPEQIARLGHDIFDYFGLGCRSVSKIYIPEHYDIAQLYEGIADFHSVSQHHKYGNNYDYNKSIFLINGDVHFDNGFLLLKEDKSWASPLAVVHFERYAALANVANDLDAAQDQIQCVVTNAQITSNVPVFSFGESQCPALDDYADGVDILAFLEQHR